MLILSLAQRRRKCYRLIRGGLLKEELHERQFVLTEKRGSTQIPHCFQWIIKLIPHGERSGEVYVREGDREKES